MSDRAQQETGENETLHRYKTQHLSGKSKKSCNSVSVGAFLDDDDMSLEEVKNRQNAARSYNQAVAPHEPTIRDIGSSQRDILSIECMKNIIQMGEDSRTRAEKDVPASKNGFCSPVASDRIAGPHRRHQSQGEEGFASPVSNLMEEFDKLACQDPILGAESFSGKPSQTAAENKGEGSPAEGTRQLRKCKDLTHSPLPKPSAAAGKAEETKRRTEVETQPETEQASAENRVWGGNTLQSCGSKWQPDVSSQCSLNAPSPVERERRLFLLGEQPTKLDNDVLTALHGVEIDSQSYPVLYKWNLSVRFFSSAERQSWPSPSLKGKLKSQTVLSPSSSPAYYSPGKSSPGKYSTPAAGFSRDFGSPGRYSPAYVNLLSKRHHLSGPPIH
ncbi:hypothetical protein JRQ81_007758 [Phrynocephalus forsythii]|uniref:Uncharacterized protein n=1 Tax=Phrynocephalus forsythii TaxID=171643 RepID=A0A9Q1AT10_9SAUR|nr:hypothetical protein JRQ81_007758 [Phrynocephalus forsythii]